MVSPLIILQKYLLQTIGYTALVFQLKSQQIKAEFYSQLVKKLCERLEREQVEAGGA